MSMSCWTGWCMALMVVAVGGSTRAAEAERAQRILAESGLKGGLIVHVGCGQGRLTAALRVNARYTVHGLDADPGHVAAAREYVARLRMYGPVSCDRLVGQRLPYVDNLVNLLVVEDASAIPMEEIKRVLVPNGVALVKQGGEWK